eukprot:7304-Heterococcus_DN1.PRE.2
MEIMKKSFMKCDHNENLLESYTACRKSEVLSNLAKFAYNVPKLSHIACSTSFELGCAITHSKGTVTLRLSQVLRAGQHRDSAHVLLKRLCRQYRLCRWSASAAAATAAAATTRASVSRPSASDHCASPHPFACIQPQVVGTLDEQCIRDSSIMRHCHKTCKHCCSRRLLFALSDIDSC